MRFNINKASDLLNELEEQQYSNPYHFEDAPLREPGEKGIFVWIIILSCLCLVLILSGFLFKYPIYVDLPFRVSEDVPSKYYSYTHNVAIENIYVLPEQKVKKGDTLFRVTSPEIVKDLTILYDLQHARNHLLMNERQVVVEKNKVLDIKSDNASELLNFYLFSRDSLESLWHDKSKKYKHTTTAALSQMNRSQFLLEEGVASQSDMEEDFRDANQSEVQYLISKGEHQKENRNIQQCISDLSTKIIEFKQERRVQNLAYENSLKWHEQQIQQAYFNINAKYGRCIPVGASILLVAEFEGEVAYLMNESRVLYSNELLCKITPVNKGFRMEAFANATQIGRIIPTKKAVLKLHSFPYFEFGTLQAEVVSCSKSPNEKEYYAIALKYEKGKLSEHLRDGLTGTATIELMEKTFFQYLFNRSHEYIDPSSINNTL